jgi:hypothetical protein
VATLTYADDTGTLVRDEAHRAARDAHVVEAGVPGIVDLPTGKPPVLVHPYVWLPTPDRYEPPPGRDLDELVDQALAPVRHRAGRTIGAVPRSQTEREQVRNRTLGWSLVIGLWAVAAALLVPLLLGAVVSAFDMTVDLNGTDEVVADDAPAADG